MWNINFSKKAKKQFIQLPKQVQINITNAIDNKLSINPNLYLIRLSGNKKDFYKFRIWDYRLICFKKNQKLIITVIKIKHRKDVYK